MRLKVSELPSFGRILKHWRNTRGKSQLDLALDAGVSARHLSFIESGRANPSREMVLLLAGVLEMPLRERNDLLHAAGYANHFRHSELAAPDLEHVRQAIDLILQHQEPFPAVVMDRYWNILNTNRAAAHFFGFILGDSASPDSSNVVRLVFHPQGLRPWIANWESVAESLIQRVHREAVGGVPDEITLQLLSEVRAYPEVPAHWSHANSAGDVLPVIPLQFRKEGKAFDYFSTVTTLGTPRDITLQEIRIECFFPANELTRRTAHALAKRKA